MIKPRTAEILRRSAVLVVPCILIAFLWPKPLHAALMVALFAWVSVQILPPLLILVVALIFGALIALVYLLMWVFNPKSSDLTPNQSESTCDELPRDASRRVGRHS